EQEVGVGGELLVPEGGHRALARAQRRHVAGGAPDLGEQLAAPAPLPAELRGGGKRQEAHEGVRAIGRVLVVLGVLDGPNAGGNGSWPIPSACLSAGVVCCWTTNPPSSTSGSQTPPFLNAVACTSTSSPRPPAVGFSWHSPQAVELKRGPSPFSGVNTLSNTTL